MPPRGCSRPLFCIPRSTRFAADAFLGSFAPRGHPPAAGPFSCRYAARKVPTCRGVAPLRYNRHPPPGPCWGPPPAGPPPAGAVGQSARPPACVDTLLLRTVLRPTVARAELGGPRGARKRPDSARARRKAAAGRWVRLASGPGVLPGPLGGEVPPQTPPRGRPVRGWASGSARPPPPLARR